MLRSMWDLPGSEPLSPALAGRFFTAEPPRKPSLCLLSLHSSGKSATVNFYTARFQRCELCSRVQPLKLVSGARWRVCASFRSGGAYVYFTVQYCPEYRGAASLFQAQDVWTQAEKQPWYS